VAEEHIELGSVAPPAPQAAQPPGRRLRTRTIVLGGVGLVAVAAVVTGCVFGARVLSQKDATLTTPDTIGAFTHNTGSGAGTAADLGTALGAGVGLDRTVGAVYTDPSAADRSVLFAGGTRLSLSPSSDLDSALDLLDDNTGKVTGRHEVDAGHLGGVMKCGAVPAAVDAPAMAVCGWADYGSVAIALFPNRDVNESARLLRQFRSAIQHRR
jgi:hypothetical protein